MGRETIIDIVDQEFRLLSFAARHGAGSVAKDRVNRFKESGKVGKNE